MFYLADLSGGLVVLVVAVTYSINKDVVALEQLPEPIPPINPPTCLATEIRGTRDDFPMYHWDDFNDTLVISERRIWPLNDINVL